MKKSQLCNFLMGGFLLLIVSGCASPISENLRKEAMPRESFSLVFENPDHFQDNTVVWGGSIIRTITDKDGSQVSVLGISRNQPIHLKAASSPLPTVTSIRWSTPKAG